MRCTPPGSYREILQQLIEGLNREHLTSILSHELGTHSESQLTLEAADSLVDTVIRLRRTLNSRRIQRSVEVVKSRGQDFEPGEHTLRIQDGKGLEVFRRVQAPLRSLEQPTSTARRSVIGVDALDALLGGGIFDGSTTMVVGLSGVGKTVWTLSARRHRVTVGFNPMRAVAVRIFVALALLLPKQRKSVQCVCVGAIDLPFGSEPSLAGGSAIAQRCVTPMSN